MIKLVTDSACDISVEESLLHKVEILPILLTYGDTTVKEFYDITNEEYYEILEQSSEVPKTAQITLESLFECFKTAEKDGYTELLYITINSKGSGTYQTAMIARDMYYEENGQNIKIEIVDSTTYSYLYGSVVLECAKMRDDGKNLEEIIAFANETLPKMRGIIGVSDLKQLKKSGRVSGGAAFVGDALGLKPIIQVGNYETSVFTKVRGQANIVKKIVELANLEAKNFENAYIISGKVPETEIAELETELLKSFKNVKKVKFGASITTNIGPRSLGVVYHI